MKRSIILLAVFLTSAMFAQTTPNTQLKIGYVDSEVIMSQFSEAIKAKSDLDGLVTKWRAEADSMNKEIQTLYANFQAKDQTNGFKGDEKAVAQKNLVDKDQKLQQYNQAKFGQPNGEYFVKQDQLLAPVKKKIFAAIETVAKEENMQYVLDKNGDVIVLYADPQFDITFKVLDRLKRGK